ncbi:MAG: calcium-binding protein [Shimia sp.]|uniref:calcium-binding protein n=1 Tax=Shimia sp. TaxID=1954381 RepID=UPI003B8B4663
MPDDHSDTIAGATSVSLGTPFSGVVDHDQDRDKFAIQLTAGQSYTFSVYLNNMTTNMSLSLYEPDGDRVAYTNHHDREDSLKFNFLSFSYMAQETKTVYLSVDHYTHNSFFSFENTYSGTVVAHEDDFPNRFGAPSETFNAGDTVEGAINFVDDVDVVRFNVEEGGIYRIVFDEATAPLTPNLNYMSWSGGRWFTSNWADTIETGGELLFLADSDDPVEFYLKGTAPSNYSYTIEKIGDDDHQATRHTHRSTMESPTNATRLGANTPIEGSIAYDFDADAFSFFGSRDSSYALTIEYLTPDTLKGVDMSFLRLNADWWPNYTRTDSVAHVTFEWTSIEHSKYDFEIGNFFSSNQNTSFTGDYSIYVVDITDLQSRTGDEFNNLINASDESEFIQAFGGDDTVESGKGADKVYLGGGNDTVFVGGGAEQFHGGSGHDRISYFNSRNGVNINLQTNEVSGSWASNDTISGFESVDGSEFGRDVIRGTSGANTIRTFGGNDKVYAGKGSDTVLLGDGNDYVRVGGGAEVFHGGAGTDHISYYDSRNGVTINLETDEVSGSWASNDTISGFENVSGSKTGDDTITGTSGANKIKTYGGDDIIHAGGGNDKVYAGKGNDTVNLGDGNDYVRVGGGREEFHGGDGNDYLSYYDSRNGVNVNLETNEVSGSWASNDTISGFENVSGSKTGDDTITGTSGANMIRTYGGDDNIFAGDGNDTVYAGKGNDRVFLGEGDDYVFAGGGAEYFDGGYGHDIISYRDSRAGVVIDLQADMVSGSWAVNDTIKNFESAAGSQSGHNKIFGTSGTNHLDGFDGNDTLYGRDGNDVLTGRDGNDELYGGVGNDRLSGGTGNNALIGGAGADTFEFDLEALIGGQSSRSVIQDFEDDVDTIRIYTTRSVGNDISDYAQQVGDDLLLEVNSQVSLMIWDMTLAALQDDVVFELV